MFVGGTEQKKCKQMWMWALVLFTVVAVTWDDRGLCTVAELELKCLIENLCHGPNFNKK